MTYFRARVIVYYCLHFSIHAGGVLLRALVGVGGLAAVGGVGLLTFLSKQYWAVPLVVLLAAGKCGVKKMNKNYGSVATLATCMHQTHQRTHAHMHLQPHHETHSHAHTHETQFW